MRLLRMMLLSAAMLALCIPLSAQNESVNQTVSAFLSAWNERDSAAMWAALSRDSQQAYPQEVFANRYTVANSAMGLSSIAFTIKKTEVQGVTAAVTYDVVIESSLFGEITDQNRMMRLVNDGGRWGVAWSSMDIFPELPSVGQLTSDGRLPTRANIYDRDGQQVAGRGTVVTLYTARQNMANEDSCKSLISWLTRRPYQAFENLFAIYNPDTDFVLTELNQEDFLAHESNIRASCGLSFFTERQTRTYYGNNVMAHVAGYVGQIRAEQQESYVERGYSVGDLIGQGGVEQLMERQLAGTPDRVLRITEPGGLVLREFASTSGSSPAPVQMTINREFQKVVAQAMFDAYDYAYPTWGNPAEAGADGAAVVLDVHTGEILAMVSFPLFDPLLFDPTSPEPERRVELLTQVNADTREPFRNHAVEDRYTPGSIYKLITAAAVLNEGVVSPDDTFDCQLRWFGRAFGDDFESRPDWRETDEWPPAGVITPAEAIMTSCNPFFWEYGALLFNDQGHKQGEYARMFGLGEPYNIFGTNEAAADLDNPQVTSQAINTAVGQGDVSVSPIQMAVAVAAIANGGTVYKPYVVKQVGGIDGTEVRETFEPTVIRELDFDPSVLETIREGMCGATTHEDLGTATIRFDDAPYHVCGKTGTASTARYPNAWFVAYGPAENPEIAISVVVSQSLEGSQVAAPITRRIFDWYFNAPEKEFPDWWAQGPYEPLNIPAGSTGG